MTPVFIIGCGDVGCRVAKLWQAKGAKVSGLARRDETVQRLVAAGITPVRGDLDDACSLIDLPTGGAIVYYFAPPPGEGVTDPRIARFFAAIPPEALPAKIVYISTTAVYGDCQGQWINEETPVHPENDRGRRRLAAEQALTEWGEHNNVPVVIVRVGGIYGPGRLPIERVAEGLPVVREEESPPTNRIHVDDLAMVCVAAALHGKAGGIYNATDGHPTTMTDYLYRIADLMDLPRPPAVSWEEAQQQLSPGMLSFLRDAKRIDNSKLLEELQVELRYPYLENGLPVSLP